MSRENNQRRDETIELSTREPDNLTTEPELTEDQFLEQGSPAAAEAADQPPAIQDILDAWNTRFPDDSRILDLDGLAALVTQEEIDEAEFILIQTLLAFLVDAQTYQAGLNVVTEVAQAFITRNAKKAGKGLRSDAAKRRLKDDARTAGTVLLGLSVDIQDNEVDPVGLLRDFQSSAYKVEDFADDLITIDQSIDTEYKEAGVR